MLELPIQGKAALLSVVTEQRSDGVHLAERGTGRYLVTEGGRGVGNKIVGEPGLGEAHLTTLRQYLLPHCPFGHRLGGGKFWFNLFES